MCKTSDVTITKCFRELLIITFILIPKNELQYLLLILYINSQKI